MRQLVSRSARASSRVMLSSNDNDNDDDNDDGEAVIKHDSLHRPDFIAISHQVREACSRTCCTIFLIGRTRQTINLSRL